MTLTLKVYESDWTYVDDIDPGQFLLADGNDLLSAPGKGTISLPQILANGAANPALALIEVGRIIQFRVDDSPVWSMLVEDYSSTIVAGQREEAGEVTEVTGRGTLAILDKVRVRPDAGVGNLPFHPTRWFNHSAASLRTDDAGSPQGAWTAAVGQLPNYDTDNYLGRPEGFTDTAGPDGDGPEWLWDRDTRIDFAPGGFCYGRQSFTLSEPTSMVFEAAADDEVELWVDNVPLIRTEGVYAGACAKAGVRMAAGTHLLAWRGRNLNALRAGVVYAGWSLSSGLPNELVMRSDASLCEVLGYPDDPPGFTPTEVVLQVLDEEQALDRLLNVTCSFTADADTDSAAVESVTDITCNAPGDSFLTLVEMLAETYLDVSIDPAPTTGDHVVNAWIRGTKGSDLSGTVGFTKGTCRVVRHDVIGSARATAALVSGNTFAPFVKVHPSAGTVRDEVALDFGDASASAAGKFADEYLELAFNARRGITLELVPGVGPTPYVDFEVGDSIAVPGLDGEPETHRVVGIGFTVGADSVLRWSVELDQPKQAVEERLGAIMRRQMPGSAGGRTLLPAPTPAQFQPNDRGREMIHTFQWDGTVAEPE